MSSAMNSTADMGQLKRTGRLAGGFYLLLFVAGIVAEFAIRSQLIVPGDPTATAAEIAAAEGLFRWGIAADLIMIISDIALALLFYELLKPVSRLLALGAALFRLAQATALGINLLNLFIGLSFVTGAEGLSALAEPTAQTLGLLFLEAHGIGYSLALVFFGVALAILGYLIIKAPYMPSILGYLILIAAAGYLTDSFAKVILVDYGRHADIFDMAVFTPAFVAELALSLWLLIRGVRTPR